MNNVTQLRPPSMGGTVTPPKDFQPAIDALTDVGRAWLKKRCRGREITPKDLAQAADFERGNLNE